MSEISFPGPGPDGGQPPPGGPVRDEAVEAAAGAQPDGQDPRPAVPESGTGGECTGPTDDARAASPAGVAEDDWGGDAEMAAYIADLDAGRARVPEEWEIEGPAATIGLGDAADVDLTELAALLGPDGLGGDVFAQDRSADVMRPGPVLAALTEQAAGDFGRLSDNQVLGAVSAAGRLAARAEYLELAAVAEFTRRRTLAGFRSGRRPARPVISGPAQESIPGDARRLVPRRNDGRRLLAVLPVTGERDLRHLRLSIRVAK